MRVIYSKMSILRYGTLVEITVKYAVMKLCLKPEEYMYKYFYGEARKGATRTALEDISF